VPKAPPATTTTAAPTTTTQAPTTTTPAAPAPTPAPTGPAGPGHPEAATIALRYLGVPYVWGGATPTGFDCSGLVMYVYAQLGISLPHFAAAQYSEGTPVARTDLQPGDLVFFDGLNHVGIYIGNGQLVHAPQTGDVVKISSVSDWGDGYVGARRI
jgi:cell wall-associated NlpC family hydrolase